MSLAKKVSCLCITQPGREAMLAEARAAFDAQTYSFKELVVVIDTKDGRTLGDLRNEALDRATGDYVATWDDDDLSHPARLAVQVDAMERHGVPLGFLSLVTLRCVCGFEATSQARYGWENTMVADRALIESLGLRYPSRDRAEDTAFIGELMKAVPKAVQLQDPALYTYCFHGGNTWNAEHWDGLMFMAGTMHAPSLCVGAR
jgi:glycosyltransferase involved in cell wall biosynthesis